MENDSSPSPSVPTGTVTFSQKEVVCQSCQTLYLILIPSDATGEDFSQCPNPSCAKVLRLDYDTDASPLIASEAEPGF